MMMKKSIMVALAGISMLGASPLFAQGIGHTWFMRGSIVDTGSNGTVVCIGKADGAEVGQKLEVYRVVTHPGPSKGVAPTYHRQLIGHVTIDHIFDDHFAHVSVADGTPAKHDIVELRKN
ncbi:MULTISPECIES: hypothetical protein [Sphingomonadales]|jgi:hypothetical protein|nr:hypothetical protein SKA58_18940 [Sphingomonas sp. SKA58]KEZ15174.1 hypothetical protein CP98_04576 [Sphingobium yanoikuyae]